MDTGSKLMMLWPASSVLASRLAPVPWEVTLTEAPEIAEPDLSVTEPRKLPVAWPYAICPQQAATIQTTTAVRILLHILLTSLGNPTKRIFRIQSLKTNEVPSTRKCQEPRRSQIQRKSLRWRSSDSPSHKYLTVRIRL